jgi:uncharacterized protein YbjT (DUF2867 family)
MTPRTVTVFGGTGFLGRRIVRHLHEAGHVVRIAIRSAAAISSAPVTRGCTRLRPTFTTMGRWRRPSPTPTGW